MRSLAGLRAISAVEGGAERLAELEELARYKREWRLLDYEAYPKQRVFHFAPKKERALIAGNKVGKTYSAGNELAMHLTGIYPSWWRGKRFDEPIIAWVGGVTGEAVRDTTQRILLGGLLDIGTGVVPKSKITKTVSARGIPEAIEVAYIKHKSGGTSELIFKAYSDGREKWQGADVHVVWYDEEPPLEIYTEGLTRTNAVRGMVMCTFTPLLGMSDVVMRFMKGDGDSFYVNMTIDDALHYSEAERIAIIAQYPPHEREARAKGLPMLGSGRIFTVPESDFVVKPFPIPEHYKCIGGLDFGYGDHPNAAVKLAVNPETSVVYLVAAVRQRGLIPAVHALTLRDWGKELPWAWPQDGMQRDRGSVKQIAHFYRDADLHTLSEWAQFPDERGNGLEAGITDMQARFETGKLKVFEDLHDWLEEYRYYHRKEGKVVAERDDLLCATRYALMMLRYARSYVVEPQKRERYSKPRVKYSSWMSA